MQIKKIKKQFLDNSGVALFVAVLTAGIALAIGAGVLNITLKEIKLSSLGRESSEAFYAADTGLECALYWDVNQDVFPLDQSMPDVGGGVIGCAYSVSVDSTIKGVGSATTTFTVSSSPDINDQCVSVTVAKVNYPTYITTTVDSRGLNSCNPLSSKRVERGIRVEYVSELPPVWKYISDTPANLWSGGSIEYNPGDNHVYVLRGYGTTDFWRYSVSGGGWDTSLPAAPGFIGRGADLEYFGGYLYAMAGNGSNEFWRYSTAGGWEVRDNTPSAVNFGGTLAHVNDAGTDYLYAIQGWGTSSQFWRFNLSSQTWDATPADPPVALNFGGGGHLLAYPGSGDYLYTLFGSGANSTDFWRYSISGDSWSQLANPTPEAQGGGTTILSLGDGQYLYMFLSSGDGCFYRYTISSDSWTHLIDTPLGECPAGAPGGAPLDRGADITYDGTYIYGTQGNYQTSFWRLLQ